MKRFKFKMFRENGESEVVYVRASDEITACMEADEYAYQNGFVDFERI